jgi:pimeloyl-ACP methyl ester carboxylesterase
MLALGYNEYVTQGGDWGFFITRTLSVLYPNNVKAQHTNWIMAGLPPFLSAPLHFTTSIAKFAGAAIPGLGWMKSYLPSLTYSQQEMDSMKSAKEMFEGDGRGYFSMFATRPQAFAYSLSDSPAGLVGLLFEKLVVWTDDYPWTDDEVLTWVSIYWHSEAGPGASGLIYKEGIKQMTAGSMQFTKLQGWTDVPLGLSYFPKEVCNMPKSWAARMGKLVFIGEHDKGGHFAAFEQPEALVADLKAMFGKGGGAFGVVEGADGF